MTDRTPAQLAGDAAAAIRAFTDRTRLTPQAGWEDSDDAYAAIGALQDAATRLPQAIGQIHRFLRDLENAGALRTDDGTPQTLEKDLAYTYAGLSDARETATVLGAALSRAHGGLSPIRPASADRATSE